MKSDYLTELSDLELGRKIKNIKNGIPISKKPKVINSHFGITES